MGARRSLLALLVGVAALPGCGTADDAEQARDVVARFYDAIRQERPEEACAQLSAPLVEQLESQTEQPCPGAIAGLSYEGGAIVATHVFVTNAKVDLRNGESAFLSREREGWRLSAIACEPEDGKPRDRPFDCEVES